MDELGPEEHHARVEAFGRQHLTGLVTLLFTDMVDSTALKQRLGRQGFAIFEQHHQLIRAGLIRFPNAQEIETAGDSFFLIFAVPSDAVEFALDMQAKLRTLFAATGIAAQDRIGINLGEVVIREPDTTRQKRGLFGLQVDTCARVMSLAKGGQILMTRQVFDSARQVLKGEAIQGLGRLSWVSHGYYQLKGVEEPTEVCEVAEMGQGMLTTPPTSEKARRYEAVEAEPVLGWRPAVGQVVPNTQWVIEQHLGYGGFGEVWLGRHQKLKEQRVFKFCFRADRVRSLKREVTLFRVLKERTGGHPNIVGVQDVFFEEPPYYVMMEYAAGKDLANWCAGQGGIVKVPLETRLEIVAQVAEALQAAHDAGIIHRDVKPGNILVNEANRPDNGERETSSNPGITEQEKSGFEGTLTLPVLAKLTDFGIGQVLSEEYLAGLTRSGFTQTLVADASSSKTGSQMYMAPELLAGKPASIRSDIYSLGVVLYQLLVSDFTRPVTTDWGYDVPDPLLRDDLQHCFAGNPNERFTGAEQLTRNLRTLRARQAARLQLEKAERASRRRRQTAGLVACAAILLLLLAIALGYGLRRAWGSELEARERLYASDMKLTYQAWEKNNLGYALTRLDRHRPKPGQKTDLRGWEWRLLWQLCQSDEMLTLGHHSNTVNFAVFSTKGDFLATSSYDQTFRFWDVGRQRETAALPLDQPVLTAAFRSDGKTLATLSYNGTLRLWDFTTRRELATITCGSISGLRDAEFSPDGRFLGLSDGSGNLSVWDVAGQTLIASISDRPACCMAFSPDGIMLATGYSDSNVIQFWDLNRKQLAFSLTNRAKLPNSLAFSHDGKTLACVILDGKTITLWDLANREIKRYLSTDHRHLAFLPGDQMVVSAGGDRTIKLWDVETGEATTLYGLLNEVMALAVATDGLTLATGTKVDGDVTLWSTSRGTSAKTRAQVSQISSVEVATPGITECISQDGSTLLILYPEGSVGVWDTATFKEKAKFEQKATAQYGVSPTGRLIALRRSSGAIEVVETSTGKRIATLAGGRGFEPLALTLDEKRLAFSPDEKRLAWPTLDGRIRVSEIASEQPVIEIVPGKELVLGSPFAFSTDGSKLGVGFADGTTEVYEVSSGRRLAVLQRHKDGIGGIAFLPDDKTVATAGWDQTVKLWDIKTQRELVTLGGQMLAYFALAVSPDGRRLAAGGGDGTIQVWDTTTYQEVISLKRDADEIVTLAFSPDGATLFAAGFETKGKRILTLQVWRAPSFADIDAAEIAKTRKR